MAQIDKERRHVMKFIRKVSRQALFVYINNWFYIGGVVYLLICLCLFIFLRVVGISDFPLMMRALLLVPAIMGICAIIRVAKGFTYIQAAAFADDYLSLEHKLVTAEQVIRLQDYSPSANLVVQQAGEAIGEKFPKIKIGNLGFVITITFSFLILVYASFLTVTWDTWVWYYHHKYGDDSQSPKTFRIDASEFERKLLELVKTPADRELAGRAAAALEINDTDEFRRIVELLRQRGIDVENVMESAPAGSAESVLNNLNNKPRNLPPSTEPFATKPQTTAQVSVYNLKYKSQTSRTIPENPTLQTTPATQTSNWDQVKLKAMGNKVQLPADPQIRKVAEEYLNARQAD